MIKITFLNLILYFLSLNYLTLVEMERFLSLDKLKRDSNLSKVGSKREIDDRLFFFFY